MEEINSHEKSGWKSPVLLNEGGILPWPEEVFPEPFGIFAKELSRSVETPPELAGMLLLAVVAAVVQKKYRIQVKEDYQETVNLWILGILPPASRKSKIYTTITAPLRDWECEQKILLEPLIQQAVSRRKTMESRLKELRNQAAKESEVTCRQIQKEIERIECELPEIPICPRLWTGDITPEQLRDLMAANGESIAALSDEGGLFDILNGLYSDGNANIDLFLQAHCGSSVRIDRKSSPPVFMKSPLLTMGLTVQPSIIQAMCKKPKFRGRGLLGRILYVMPHSNIGHRTWEEPPMNPSYYSAYKAALNVMLKDCFTNQKASLCILSLASDAYARWLEYAKLIEKLMGPDIAQLAHIMDWAGKLPGAIARIAAILHIMKFGASQELQISLQTMNSAIKIGHALSSHALAAFNLMEEGNVKQDAIMIYEWIKSMKFSVVSKRDCSRRFRRLKKELLSPALEILQEHEILREVQVANGGPGRPKEFFEVNPFIFE